MCELENMLDLDFCHLDSFTDTDFAEMEGFISDFNCPPCKPMDQWDSSEVVNFISNEIYLKPDEWQELERFQCISGYILKHLSEENCKRLSQNAGELIFDAKEKYLKYNPPALPEHPYYSPNKTEEDVYRFENQNVLVQVKKPGRPRSKPFSTRNGKKSEKLWEFLVHLLQDESTCPQLIKWENFEEGTFKFVQSSKVARLWGNRKQNENMTYEKFSRAMRYYYKSKVLLPVPGKRLVYKFGPQAKGWNSMVPIS